MIGESIRCLILFQDLRPPGRAASGSIGTSDLFFRAEILGWFLGSLAVLNPSLAKCRDHFADLFLESETQRKNAVYKLAKKSKHDQNAPENVLKVADSKLPR